MFIYPFLFVDDSAKKGRAVYTSNIIQKDTVIEISPVIVMQADDQMLLDKTLLHDYIFEWEPNGEKFCCMALGYVPLYNHSYKSNCEYEMDYEKKVIFIKTVRKIKKDEELTINYNGDWDDATPVWFEDLEERNA